MTNPTRSTRRALAASAAVAALGLLAACGSSSASKETSGSGADTTAQVAAAKAELAKFKDEITEFPKVPAVSGASTLKGKTVWYIPFGSSVPTLATYGVGVEEAMEKLGVTVHTCDGKFLPTAVASCMNQAVTARADGVITAYIDYKLASTGYDKLVAERIPVLLAGQVPGPGQKNSAAMAFDARSDATNKLEALTADAIIADSGGKANVLYIGVGGSAPTLAGTAFTQAYYKSHCSQCTVTKIEYNPVAPDKIPSMVSTALIKNPDINYLMPQVDPAAGPALAGAQSAGFTNKVKLASSNGSLDSLQRIKAGGPQFVDVGDSTVYVGWGFADSMVRQLLGKEPVGGPGLTRVFDKSNVSDLPLTPAAYNSNQWYGSDDYQKNFLKAWGMQ